MTFIVIMPSVHTHNIDKPTCLSLRRAKATNYTSESHSVLRKLRHFTPWEPHLLSFLFNIPPPGVSWSSFLPLPLRVPCQSLSSDAFFWLPQGMTYPFPLPHFYVFLHWSLASSAPQFIIVILSGQWIRRIFLRQEFTNICTLLMGVAFILQVSDPYNKTGFTKQLNILIFVFSWCLHSSKYCSTSWKLPWSYQYVS